MADPVYSPFARQVQALPTEPRLDPAANPFGRVETPPENNPFGRHEAEAAAPAPVDDDRFRDSTPENDDIFRSPMSPEVVHRYVKDAVDTVGDLWDMAKRAGHDVMHPSDLLQDAKDIASGAADAVSSGAKFAVENPTKVPGKVGEFVADQVTQHPTQTALNILTAGPKGGVLGKGLRETVGDPNPVANALAGVANHTTGVGEGVMQEAFRTGKMGDKIAEDFRTAMRDPATGMEMALGNAKQGVQTMKNAMFDKYKELEPLWKGDNTKINFKAIDAAEAKMLDEITVKDGRSFKYKVSDTDLKKIRDLQGVVDQWRKDPGSWTMEGFDGLKQRLRNEVNFKSDNTPVIRAATQLSNSAKDAILSQVPDSAPYKASMRHYMEASDTINEIEQGLSLGKKATTNSSIVKLQSIMRNNAQTLYGSRKALAEELEKSGNVSLMPSLAGAAASATTGRGIQRGVMAGGLPGLAMMAAEHGVTVDALLAGGIGLGLTSPRLMGEAFHGAGRLNHRLGPVAREATIGPPAAALRYAAQPPREEAEPELPAGVNPFGTRRARGGYFSRGR